MREGQMGAQGTPEQIKKAEDDFLSDKFASEGYKERNKLRDERLVASRSGDEIRIKEIDDKLKAIHREKIRPFEMKNESNLREEEYNLRNKWEERGLKIDLAGVNFYGYYEGSGIAGTINGHEVILVPRTMKMGSFGTIDDIELSRNQTEALLNEFEREAHIDHFAIMGKNSLMLILKADLNALKKALEKRKNLESFFDEIGSSESINNEMGLLSNKIEALQKLIEMAEGDDKMDVTGIEKYIEENKMDEPGELWRGLR